VVDEHGSERPVVVGHANPGPSLLRRPLPQGTGWIITVVSIYLGLLLVCVVIMTVIAATHSGDITPSDAPATRLFSLAADTFRILLGALLGALSVVADRVLPARGDGRP
jgi:hypothetical protein